MIPSSSLEKSALSMSSLSSGNAPSEAIKRVRDSLQLHLAISYAIGNNVLNPSFSFENTNRNMDIKLVDKRHYLFPYFL